MDVNAGPIKPKAEERILNYESEIFIRPDSSLDVIEKITIWAEGIKIKRGIFRDFPTKYNLQDGSSYYAGFKVVEVLRDGRKEPYHVEMIDGGYRVYIGEQYVFLNPGQYTYTLHYKTDRHILFNDGFDELNWNVTGTRWDFSIGAVSAIVHLPDGAGTLRSTAYTGTQGSRAQHYQSFSVDAGTTKFFTIKPLNRHEGFTVAVSWPSGFVTEPTEVQYIFRHHPALLPGLIIFAGLLLYFVMVWHRFGRDSLGKGTIIPLFHPPANISPALMDYILTMGRGKSNKRVTAAIVNMAVKKFLKIEQMGRKKYKLVRLADNYAGLSQGEKAAAKALFPQHKGAEIEIDKDNYAILGSARGGLTTALKKECGQKYFVSNLPYVLIGIAASLIYFIYVLLAYAAPLGTIFSGLIAVAVFITMFFLIQTPKTSSFGVYSGILFFLGRILFFFALLFFVLRSPIDLDSVPASYEILLFSAMILLSSLFFDLMNAPTRTGRRLMDQIEGFKLFLSVAEKERFKALHPPDITPEVFEKYLPYAIVLGVEKQWSEKFSDAMQAAAIDPKAYRPGWYGGMSYRGFTPGFAAGFSSAFSSSLASAATAPSSGFSGSGGFSGGGGGGGGGGGW